MFMGKGHPVSENESKILLFCDLEISTGNKLNKNLCKL